MTDVAAEVLAVRSGAGLFALESDATRRGLVEVTGGDATRWLDGMVTNDITTLGAGAESNGCYAALLTPKGRIIADLNVLARPEGYWLETSAFVVDDVMARLDRYIVADDVKLVDRSRDFARLGIEGPGSASWLAQAAGSADASELEARVRGCWVALRLEPPDGFDGSDAIDVVAARFGWTGEDAWQLFLPAARRAETVAWLQVFGGDGRAGASDAALDVLRIEAGVPALGPELDEEVFPDEAGLDAAVSRTKGCYTGQEIVARLYSRGAVNHMLVALRFEGERAPASDSELFVEDRRTGEVTSSTRSPTAGTIGLGYVRTEHAEPGTRLRCEDPEGEVAATVAERPLVGSGLGSGSDSQGS
jgi:folate-binding protein YgfZ